MSFPIIDLGTDQTFKSSLSETEALIPEKCVYVKNVKSREVRKSIPLPEVKKGMFS